MHFDKFCKIFIILIHIPPPYSGTKHNMEKAQADCIFVQAALYECTATGKKRRDAQLFFHVNLLMQ